MLYGQRVKARRLLHVLRARAVAAPCLPAQLPTAARPPAGPSCRFLTHPPARLWPPPQECKISGQAGFTKEITYGGGSYQLPLASISFDWDTTPTPP